MVRGVPVNYLLFAYDCVLFGRAKLDEWNKLQRVLKRHEKAYGQSLNKDKTSIFFNNNTRTEDKNKILRAGSALVCCSCEKYLGLPIMAGRSKYNTYRDIKERVWQKVNNWKQGRKF